MKKNSKLESLVENIIAERTQRGKKLAKRFSDFPKGLSYTDFLERCFDEGLSLDFITSSEMFNEYEELKENETKDK